MENNEPVLKIRDKNFQVATFLKAIDFKGDGRYIDVYSLCLQRGWKDKDGKWHNQTINMDLEDALLVQSMMNSIYIKTRNFKERREQEKNNGK